jgi:small subunit ribosomal protein S18
MGRRGGRQTTKKASPRGQRAQGRAARPGKAKVCVFCASHVEWVDYKDVNTLRRLLSDRGKIKARRVTGTCRQHQRDVAVAIKTARELALLPYVLSPATADKPRRGAAPTWPAVAPSRRRMVRSIPKAMVVPRSMMRCRRTPSWRRATTSATIEPVRSMNFRPKDQIVLLAGLENDAVRERIWALPELGTSVRRLTDAGLLDSGVARLSEPAGVAAARGLRHITLADLMAEHLPDSV